MPKYGMLGTPSPVRVVRRPPKQGSIVHHLRIEGLGADGLVEEEVTFSEFIGPLEEHEAAAEAWAIANLDAIGSAPVNHRLAAEVVAEHTGRDLWRLIDNEPLRLWEPVMPRARVLYPTNAED